MDLTYSQQQTLIWGRRLDGGFQARLYKPKGDQLADIEAMAAMGLFVFNGSQWVITQAGKDEANRLAALSNAASR